MKKTLTSLFFALYFIPSFSQPVSDFRNEADVICKCTELPMSEYSFYLEKLYEAVDEYGMDDFDVSLILAELSPEDSALFMEQEEGFDHFLDNDGFTECIEEKIPEEQLDMFEDSLEDSRTMEKFIAYLEEEECPTVALFFRIIALDMD